MYVHVPWYNIRFPQRHLGWDPGVFDRGVCKLCFGKQKIFLSYNLNELKNISRSVDLKFLILTSNLQSCCSENFGVRQEEKGGSGTPGTFLRGPPPRDLPPGTSTLDPSLTLKFQAHVAPIG